MAAMSAVSGAFANDFDWQGIPSRPTTDANHNVTDYKGLKYENSVLSFEVNAGDEIELTVSGKNLTVALNGSDLKTELKDGKVAFKAENNGTVSLTFGDDATSVTAITVESDNYRTALDIIKQGKASVTEALQKISNYTKETDKDGRSFSGLFSSASSLINEEAQKIAQLEADLKSYRANNTVGDKLAGMRSVETAAAANIAAIVAKAEAAHDEYIKIAFTNTEALTNRIKEAKSKDEIKNTSEAYVKTLNETTKYIYDFTYDANKKVGVAGKLKADWCQTELDNIESDLMSFREGAMGIISNISGVEDGGFAFDVDVVAQLEAQVDNMIARAIVERDYAAKIAELSDNVTALDKVLATKDADNKNVFTKPSGYDTWAKSVKTISDLIADTDSRRDFTQADLKANVIDVYNTANTTFATLKTDLAGQAATALTKLAEKAQSNIDTYSYKIAAKYENEPATQEKYQKEFAALQADLNGYKETIKGEKYEDVVLGYNALAAKIDEVNTKILGDNGLWSQTLEGQKGEVISNNNATAKKLTDKIDAIRANYNKQIESITNWKNSDFAKYNDNTALKDNGDLKTYLEARQSVLFDIVNNLDKEKVNINNAVTALNDVIPGIPDVEFDPTDEKYRFTDEKVKKYEDAITDLNKKIDEQLTLALEAANERAYYYFKNSYTIGTTMTVNGAAEIYYDTKKWLDEGYNNEKMSQDAHDKFDSRYAGILWANRYLVTVNGKQEDKGEKYLADAIAKAGSYNADKTMADNIGKLTTDYLSKIEGVVETINGQYEEYTKLYVAVRDKKVKYTEAKAKESDLVAKYKDAAGVDEATAKKFINDKLNDINTVIAEFSEKLEEKALEASTLTTDGETAFNAFDEGFIQVTDFAAYKSNKEANDEASKQITLIEAEITNLKTQIADYREDAKAVGETAIAKAETELEAQKTTIEKDFKDYKLGTTYPNSIKGVLDTILADLKAAAEEAKKVQEGGNLDYNGDGDVNIDDVKDAKADAQKTGDIKTFNDFLTKYLEFQSK